MLERNDLFSNNGRGISIKLFLCFTKQTHKDIQYKANVNIVLQEGLFRLDVVG